MDIKNYIIERQAEISEKLRTELSEEWLKYIDGFAFNLYPPPGFIPSQKIIDCEEYLISSTAIMGVAAFLAYENAFRALSLNDLILYTYFLSAASHAGALYLGRERAQVAIAQASERGNRYMLGLQAGGANSQGLTEEQRRKRDNLIIEEYETIKNPSSKSKNQIARILAARLNPRFRILFPDLSKNYSLRTFLRVLEKI